MLDKRLNIGLMFMLISFLGFTQKNENLVSILSPRVLYLNCNYQVHIPVSQYGKKAQLKVSGGECFAGEGEDIYQLTAKESIVLIQVYKGESLAYSDTLAAIEVPYIDKVISINGSEDNTHKSVYLAKELTSFSIKLKCEDLFFKTAFPESAIYRVKEFEITVIRGRNTVFSKTVKGNRISFRNKPIRLEAGDKLLIIVKDIRGKSAIYNNVNIKNKLKSPFYNISFM